MDYDELVKLFFTDLKTYNTTSFRNLVKADLKNLSISSIKAFSSVPTRFFIFCEHHPELTVIEKRILYYSLKIDMIARYFSNYPGENTEDLFPFISELNKFRNNSEVDNEVKIQDFQLESTN